MAMKNESDDSWKDTIREKLLEIYGTESPSADVTGMIRLLLVLDKSDNEYTTNQPGRISPFWRTLRMTLNLKDQTAFKLYADKMIQDSVECQKDPQFIAKMESINEQTTEPINAVLVDQLSHTNDLAKSSYGDLKGAQFGIGMGFARAWDVMTPATKQEVVSVAKSLASNFRAVSCVDECVSLANKTSGAVVMVTLAAVYLTWECYKSLSRWYKGEISGKRCAKVCVDSILEVGAGIGGGVAGAAIGSALIPGVGFFIGGIVGGLAAGAAAKRLTQKLTELIFDLPREEALETAYKYLGVHHKASNNEVSTAFKKKALMYHPDKGGDAADFHQLQVQMALIKISRGETV